MFAKEKKNNTQNSKFIGAIEYYMQFTGLPSKYTLIYNKKIYFFKKIFKETYGVDHL